MDRWMRDAAGEPGREGAGGIFVSSGPVVGSDERLIDVHLYRIYMMRRNTGMGLHHLVGMLAQYRSYVFRAFLKSSSEI